MNHNRLLRSANHTVVKGLTHQNRTDSRFNISRFVDNCRRIARTNAQSRFAGTVCRFNHPRTAGCQNHRNSFMPHQMLRQFNRRIINPADDVIRSPGLNRGL